MKYQALLYFLRKVKEFENVACYPLISDSKTVNFCEDMDVEFDNDTLASVIYTATSEPTDVKRDCHCNITSKRDRTIRLNIVDVRLTNQNGTCSPTRLRIFDTIYIVCRESNSFITGLTMWYDESLTIDLELFTSDPPQMVWASVSGMIYVSYVIIWARPRAAEYTKAICKGTTMSLK